MLRGSLKASGRKALRSLKVSLASRYQGRYSALLSSLPSGGDVRLIDIGAADAIEGRWKPYETFLHYVGFEPDERSKDLLSSDAPPLTKSYRLLPSAVWDTNGNLEFRLCRKRQVSSFFEPNHSFLRRFPQPDRFDVIEREQIRTAMLDDLEIEPPDFIKIDIQGGELNALKGAQKALASAFGLELEVEFLQLYRGQPLFGEITAYLSERGFEFLDFVDLYRWERDRHARMGQCVFADALFLKPPEDLDAETLGVNRTSAYLAILAIYRRFDLIDKVLASLTADARPAFREFEKKLEKARKVDLRARRVSRLCTALASIYGPSYRSHLLY